MKYQKGTFLIVPNKHLLKGKSPFVQTTFNWLCDHSNENGSCYPSIPLLAKEGGMSERQIIRSIEELIKMGVIKKVSRGNIGKSNLYNIIIKENRGDSQAGGGDSQAGGGVTDRQPNSIHINSGTNVPNKSSDLLNKKKDNNMKPYSELNSSDSYDPQIDLETGEEIVPAKKIKATDKFWELINWSTKRRGAPFLKQAIKKQFKAFAIAKDNKIGPTDLKERWIEMEDDKFWRNAGFDWMDVVTSFSKKPIK